MKSKSSGNSLQLTSLVHVGLLLVAGLVFSCSDSAEDNTPTPSSGGSGGSGGSKATGGSAGSTAGTSTASGGSSTGTGGVGGSAYAGQGGSEDTGGAGGSGGVDETGGTNPGGGAGGASAAKKIFDGTSLDGWIQYPANSWELKDGAMRSKGSGRGFIYTKDDYADFRVIFSVRQIVKDHKPCVLIFNTRPPSPTERGLDALGGIQFQPPQGGHWDYRPGHNDGGGDLFTKVNGGGGDISVFEWARCEILTNVKAGTGRMACCQLPGGTGTCKAKEVLRFADPTAGKVGPFAIQMHNGGIIDEYKDITMEENPAVKDLITTQ